MATITASLVKELREKTGAGMMDCKKALEACDGDIAASVDWLREKGIAKAAKKADRIAAEGLTKIVVEGNTAVMFEVNSETDFVAKNQQFLDLLTEIGSVLMANKPATMEEAMASKNAAGFQFEICNFNYVSLLRKLYCQNKCSIESNDIFFHHLQR